MENNKYYEINIAGIDKKLPIIEIQKGVSIASFVILGDSEIPHVAAKEIAKMCPQADVIITAEAKGIPFAHELARALKMSKYIVLRKSIKSYMVDAVSDTVNSITTQKEQSLFLDSGDIEFIKNKKVLLVDDVISTGESINAIARLVEKADGEIVGKVCILTEGNEEDHKDVISLGNLPIFKD